MNSNKWYDVTCSQRIFLEQMLPDIEVSIFIILFYFILFFLLLLLLHYFLVNNGWSQDGKHLFFLFQFTFLAPFCWVRSLNTCFNEIKRWCHSHFVLLWWCCSTIAASASASSSYSYSIGISIVKCWMPHNNKRKCQTYIWD